MKSRILFYSHDTFGLGHFRRSFTIASYLARQESRPSILMLTGLDSSVGVQPPDGIDFVKLPSIWKSGADDYRSRHLRTSFSRVQRLRGDLIYSVTRSFDPDLFVVDNVPTGATGELLTTLRYLRRKRPYVRIVLTLRDVLDRPDVVLRSWAEQGAYRALERFYDEIWVAGVQEVFDPIELYRFPRDVADKVRFCGYVVRSTTPADVDGIRRELRLENRRLITASCGGGGDGFKLLSTFVDAVEPICNDDLRAAVFLGPDMPPEQRRLLKERLLPLSDRFVTFDYREDLVSFLSTSDVSVSMAGYNTVTELLSLGTPSVIIPRIVPREEQLIRARAFAKNGSLRMVHPNGLTPDTLRAAILEALEQGRGDQDTSASMDFSGLRRIAKRVDKHLDRARQAHPDSDD